MPDLTPEQRKALIEVVTEHGHGWVDAWEHGLNDTDRELVAACFLAGVKWAEAQPTAGPGPRPTEGR